MAWALGRYLVLETLGEGARAAHERSRDRHLASGGPPAAPR